MTIYLVKSATRKVVGKFQTKEEAILFAEKKAKANDVYKQKYARKDVKYIHTTFFVETHHYNFHDAEAFVLDLLCSSAPTRTLNEWVEESIGGFTHAGTIEVNRDQNTETNHQSLPHDSRTSFVEPIRLLR